MRLIFGLPVYCICVSLIPTLLMVLDGYQKLHYVKEDISIIRRQLLRYLKWSLCSITYMRKYVIELPFIIFMILFVLFQHDKGAGGGIKNLYFQDLIHESKTFSKPYSNQFCMTVHSVLFTIHAEGEGGVVKSNH